MKWYNNIIKNNINSNIFKIYSYTKEKNELSILNYNNNNFKIVDFLDNVIDYINNDIYFERKNYNFNIIIYLYYLMNKFFKFHVNNEFNKLYYLNNKYLLFRETIKKSFFIIKDNLKNFKINFLKNDSINFLNCNKKFIYIKNSRYKNYNFLSSYKDKIRKKLFLKQTRFNNEIDNEDFFNFGPDNGLYFRTITNSFVKKRKNKKNKLFSYKKKKRKEKKRKRYFSLYNFNNFTKIKLINLIFKKNYNIVKKRKRYIKKGKDISSILIKLYNKKFLKYKKLNLNLFYKNYYFLLKKLLKKKKKKIFY